MHVIDHVIIDDNVYKFFPCRDYSLPNFQTVFKSLAESSITFKSIWGVYNRIPNMQ